MRFSLDGMTNLPDSPHDARHAGPEVDTGLRKSYAQSGALPTSPSGSHRDLTEWNTDYTKPQPPSGTGSWMPSVGPHQSREGSPDKKRTKQGLTPRDSLDVNILPTTWTNITSETGLVRHLLALYFCWEYPIFGSLSKEHFLEDFEHGTRRYALLS